MWHDHEKFCLRYKISLWPVYEGKGFSTFEKALNFAKISFQQLCSSPVFPDRYNCLYPSSFPAISSWVGVDVYCFKADKFYLRVSCTLLVEWILFPDWIYSYWNKNQNSLAAFRPPFVNTFETAGHGISPIYFHPKELWDANAT